MMITWQTIITAAGVLSAVGIMVGILLKAYSWYLRQQEQDKALAALKAHHDEDMKQIREENRLICSALSACLDGLMQLGCNHTVPVAKTDLDTYLNEQAHK